MNNFYSQHGEDRIISDFIGNIPIPRFCIEIGALDGIEISNIRHFVMQNFKGVFVEPLPDKYIELEKNYAGCPNVTTLNAAISGEPDEYVDFTVRNIRSWSSLNNSDSLRAHENEQIIKVRNLTYLQMLQSIHCENEEIGIISIDTEGTECEILQQVLAHKFKPWIVIIENSGESDLESQSGMMWADYALLARMYDNTLWVLKQATKKDKI